MLHLHGPNIEAALAQLSDDVSFDAKKLLSK